MFFFGGGGGEGGNLKRSLQLSVTLSETYPPWDRVEILGPCLSSNSSIFFRRTTPDRRQEFASPPKPQTTWGPSSAGKWPVGPW